METIKRLFIAQTRLLRLRTQSPATHLVIGCRKTVLFGNASHTRGAAPLVSRSLVSRSFEEDALLVGNTFSSLVPLRHPNAAL